ncbi:CLUMA_CG021035, isoform A [Clunio marinus]|uniref:CLUMA_CG021035, isoform A n=1 Tax=Clunio marinus TaxID=568069 RepID=A0A1J1J8S7_9DIPT|nr:CLUMA_CG021035, isoform A [Clunio marinus]
MEFCHKRSCQNKTESLDKPKVAYLQRFKDPKTFSDTKNKCFLIFGHKSL